MAVRFNGSTDGYICDTDLAATGTFSMCCWGTVDTNRNEYSTWLALGGTGANSSFILQTNDTSVAATVWYKGVEVMGTGGRVVLTVGKWYFLAVSVNGAAGNMYVRAHDATTMTAKNWPSGGATTMTPSNNTIGYNTAFAAEWLNGRVCAAKIWNGVALSQAEFEQEMWQVMPARTENLIGWYPLTSPETADYSGNGRTLTANGTVTVEPSPPIAWRSAPMLRQPIAISDGGGATDANAETTLATATAYDATVAIGGQAEAVTASAAAYDATVAIGGQAGAATATTAAGDATVDVSSDAMADAEHVLATATAYDASVSIGVVPGTAGIAASAHDVTAVSKIATDDFNRTDSTTLGTLSSGGYTWTEQNGSALSIVDNKMGAAGGGNTQAYIDIGASDYTVSVDVPTVSTDTHRGGIFFRGVDTDDHWRFVRDTSGTRVWKLVNNVLTTVATGTTKVNAGDRMKVVTSGDSIKCYVNDVEVHNITDSTHSTATLVGLFIIETGVQLDNFNVVVPLSGAATSANAEQPSGTATAYNATVAIGGAAGQVSTTAGVLQPSGAISGQAGAVTASVSANAPTVDLDDTLGEAGAVSATVTGEQPVSAVGALAGHVSVAVSAGSPVGTAEEGSNPVTTERWPGLWQPGAVEDLPVQAGSISVAVTANNSAPTVGTLAGTVTPTVTANNVTAAIGEIGHAEGAVSTVTANDATVSVSSFAGGVQSTVSAGQATGQLAAQAEPVSGAVQVANSTVSLSALAEDVTTSGAATNVSTATGTFAPAGSVSVSATAPAPNVALQGHAGEISGSVTAYDATVATSSLGQAEDTAVVTTANSPTVSVGPAAEEAQGAVSASDVSAQLTISSGAVGTTATAYDATVTTQTEGTGSAGLASSTATAESPSVAVHSNADVVAPSVTAYDATVQTVPHTDANAGTATSSAVVENVGASVAAHAGHVSVSVSASNVAGGVAAMAEQIAVTSNAVDLLSSVGAIAPVVDVNVLATSVTRVFPLVSNVSAQAYDATVSTDNPGNVDAGHVATTATAYNATVLLYTNRTYFLGKLVDKWAVGPTLEKVKSIPVAGKLDVKWELDMQNHTL